MGFVSDLSWRGAGLAVNVGIGAGGVGVEGGGVGAVGGGAGAVDTGPVGGVGFPFPEPEVGAGFCCAYIIMLNINAGVVKRSFFI